MNISEVKELIELINSSDIAYLELEIDNAHIKLDKSLTRGVGASNGAKEQVVKESFIETREEIKKDLEINTEEKKFENDENATFIKSPMVGTFYASPSPDSSDFVKVGDTVKTGDVLCIVEAMKLMNEIECEVNGKIIDILVKDGDMVEYGTPLFKLKEM